LFIIEQTKHLAPHPGPRAAGAPVPPGTRYQREDHASGLIQNSQLLTIRKGLGSLFCGDLSGRAGVIAGAPGVRPTIRSCLGLFMTITIVNH
jgi:hypothetical protein